MALVAYGENTPMYQRYKQGPQSPPTEEQRQGFAMSPALESARYQSEMAPFTEEQTAASLATLKPGITQGTRYYPGANGQSVPGYATAEELQQAEMDAERQNMSNQVNEYFASGGQEYESQPGVLPMKNVPTGTEGIGPMNGLDILQGQNMPENFYAQLQYDQRGFQEDFARRQRQQDEWARFRDTMNEMAKYNMENDQSLEEMLAGFGKI